MRERVIMIEPSGRGGIAQYTWCLSRALASAGASVSLLTARDYEWRGAFPVDDVHAVFNGTRTPPGELWKTLRRLAADARVWHLQSGPRPGWLAALVPVLRRAGARRVLVTAHNAVPHNAGPSGRWTSRLLFNQADALFVHGSAVKNDVVRVAGRACPPVVEIPFGDMGALPLPPARDVAREDVLFFGYIHPAKGLDVLIRAAGMLRRRGRTFRLSVAGNPEEPWEPYRKLLREEGLEDAKLDLRYVPASCVSGHFARALVVVLPHRRASQSGVLHLASRFGVPVVATRTGGMADQVRDGESGLLVPPGDPSLLAGAVGKLLDDRALAARLVAGARSIFDGSGMRVAAERTLETYRRLPGRNAP